MYIIGEIKEKIMILNKKGLAVLPLAALLFTSCAKSVSYEQAVKFVDETYKPGEVATPTKAYEEFQGKAHNDTEKEMIKKMAAAIGFELDDNLYGKLDLPLEEMSSLTSGELYKAPDEPYPDTKYEFTYKIKGKSFFQSMHAISETKEGKIETTWSNDYNDKGFETKRLSQLITKSAANDVDFTTTQTWYFTY